MAGLAVYVRVLAGILFGYHIRVAVFAGLMAGKLHRKTGNFAHCGPAIVSILPKAFGHIVMAHHKKHQESEDEKPRKPEKMACILERTHQTFSVKPPPGAARLQAGVS